MKKYCVRCAHDKHTFEIPNDISGISMPIYVLIDGEVFITLHRSPSHKVKCSDCGIKTNEVFEPLYNKKKQIK